MVGDVKQEEPVQEASATIYEFTKQPAWGGVSIATRTSLPPLSLAQAAPGAIRALDPEQPVDNIQTMDAVIDQTLTSQRFSALLLAMFAAVALSLATVGIYSVLGYIVRGRNREIAVRTALGARTVDVLKLVVIEGMTPAIIGIAAGVVGALLSATLLSKLIFGVSASDPVTLVAVAATLATVALAASLIPAYRASKLNPLDALR